jgi:ParB/RepB/Spo0J family partition protein
VKKAAIQMIDPHDLEIPMVRITSVFDEDIMDMFGRDIDLVGIEQPLLVAKSDGHLWVIDGKNRRDQALLKGIDKVPCLVREMSLPEIQMRNLVSNNLRGRTRPSEEAMVLKDLFDTHKVSIEEIIKRTGMSRDRVEELILIGRCDVQVFEALDEGRIRLCHAANLARVMDREVQLRLLHLQEQYHKNCSDFRDIVTDTLAAVQAAKSGQAPQPVRGPPPPKTATCGICEEAYPLKDIKGVNMCIHCYSLAQMTVAQMRGPAGQGKEDGATPPPDGPGGE